MRKWLPFLVLLLLLDIATKAMALRFIPPLQLGEYPFGGIALFSTGGVTFSLNTIVNTGAAWGTFAGHSGLLFIFRTAIIFCLFFFAPKRFPIWLVATGAVGNVLDYCLYGHVIDFFHFTFWGYEFPIFNCADSYITIGVAFLLLFYRKDNEVRIRS